MEKEIEHKIKKIKKSANRIIVWISAIIVVTFSLAAFLFFSYWQIYKLNSDSVVIEKISQIVPFPAAKVDNSFISYYDYLRNYQAAKKFYASQNFVDASQQDLKKIVLEDRLINSVLIKKLAKKYGLEVSSEDVENAINEIVANKGSKKEVEDFLKEYYDLTLAEYKEYFTIPNLYYSKVEAALTDDETVSGEAKKNIQQALSRLRNGEDFYAVASDYKDSLTNRDVYRGELPQEIEDDLYAMDEGKYTDVVSLPGSFQIIKLEKKDPELGVLNLSVIIVPTVAVEEVVKKEREQSEVKIYIY